MSGGRRFDPALAARSVARRLAAQALYRWQLNDSSWQDLIQEFDLEPDMAKADRDYFLGLIGDICRDRAVLDELLGGWQDRLAAALDPVEHAILWIGVLELGNRPEVPWRVAINEAVSLAKRFGATDGHKFVNAVLDKAAHSLRGAEIHDRDG
jgi:transcription antitermination protein NusB